MCHVATAGFALAAAFNLDLQVAGVAVAAWASVVAVGLRLYLPALTTQFTLLASLTGLAAAVISLIEHMVVPETIFTDSGAVVPNGGPDALLVIVATAAWWLDFAALPTTDHRWCLAGPLGKLTLGEPCAAARLADQVTRDHVATLAQICGQTPI